MGRGEEREGRVYVLFVHCNMPSPAQDNQLHQRPKSKFMENKIPHEIAVLKYFSFLLHEFHVLLRFVRKLPYSN